MNRLYFVRLYSRQGVRLASAVAAASLVIMLSACASSPKPGSAPPPTPAIAPVTPQIKSLLAPTGELRVGVYLGSPTSLVKTGSGESAGVAHDVGGLLAARLGTPVRLVQFARVAEIVEALKAGQLDFTFTNASPARAQIVDFTAPLVRLELGLLLPQGSTITSTSQMDRSGLKLGVTQGSSSQAALGVQLKQAKLFPVASVTEAQAQLKRGDIHAFATNKAILFEMLPNLSGFSVLADNWGYESLAIAIPKGRNEALPWLNQFAASLKQSGQLASITQRAGLKGVAAEEMKK